VRCVKGRRILRLGAGDRRASRTDDRPSTSVRTRRRLVDAWIARSQRALRLVGRRAPRRHEPPRGRDDRSPQRCDCRPCHPAIVPAARIQLSGRSIDDAASPPSCARESGRDPRQNRAPAGRDRLPSTRSPPIRRELFFTFPAPGRRGNRMRPRESITSICAPAAARVTPHFVRRCKTHRSIGSAVQPHAVAVRPVRLFSFASSRSRVAR